MLPIRELTLTSIAVRILLAIVLGGVIGLERGMKNRAAGLRTYMLVCMGACIVMITNLYIYQAYDTGDPVRMGAQVVSGIGFLGAGSIIVTARNQIKGLTTAAGLTVAIPCHIGYTYLTMRVDVLTLDMEKAALELTAFFERQSQTSPTEDAQ